MNYTELSTALLILGLGERATLREIKARHREMVKSCHPDTGNEGEPERIRSINAAYRVVREYIEAYRFSFSEDEFYEQNSEERIRLQFMAEPVWGKE
jgi:DnaJ-class molecular chaperone